jgi:hypothetical protein
VAFSTVVEPTETAVGGAVVKEIATLVGAEIVTVPVAFTELLVVEAAVIVTEPPLGDVAGAV